MILRLQELFSVLWENPLWQWAFYFLGLSVLVLIFIRVAVWGHGQWPYFQGPILRAQDSKKSQWEASFHRGGLLLGLSVLGFLSFKIVGVFIGFLLGVIVITGLNYKSRQTAQQRLRRQLPLFLRALGSTLKAGYSVPQALDFVAAEAEDPLREKLKSGQRLLHLKQPLEGVLNEWRSQVNIPEFSFLTDSLRLQAQSGGNLVAVCYSVASLLDERRQLEQDIRSFTAQGKMSGLLMALLWPISLALFAWLSPSHTEVLFSTTPGRILLGFSLFLELLGFGFIWRLVRLKI